MLLKMDGNKYKCPDQWNCPHCNEFYDSKKQRYITQEEYEEREKQGEQK